MMSKRMNHPDILVQIFSFLEFKFICTANLVCKRWYTVCESDSLWEKICVNDQYNVIDAEFSMKFYYPGVRWLEPIKRYMHGLLGEEEAHESQPSPSADIQQAENNNMASSDYYNSNVSESSSYSSLSEHFLRDYYTHFCILSQHHRPLLYYLQASASAILHANLVMVRDVEGGGGGGGRTSTTTTAAAAAATATTPEVHYYLQIHDIIAGYIDESLFVHELPNHDPGCYLRIAIPEDTYGIRNRSKSTYWVLFNRRKSSTDQQQQQQQKQQEEDSSNTATTGDEAVAPPEQQQQQQQSNNNNNNDDDDEVNSDDKCAHFDAIDFKDWRLQSPEQLLKDERTGQVLCGMMRTISHRAGYLHGQLYDRIYNIVYGTSGIGTGTNRYLALYEVDWESLETDESFSIHFLRSNPFKIKSLYHWHLGHLEGIVIENSDTSRALRSYHNGVLHGINAETQFHVELGTGKRVVTKRSLKRYFMGELQEDNNCDIDLD